MITIKFNGWFQCRQATDPDPADDPRGLTGQSYALPTEPDFDRIIHLQESSATFSRSHTPKIGVTVKEVFYGDGRRKNHPFIGAKLRLLNNPIYKGSNEIVAPGGREPIVPFDLAISDSKVHISRSCPGTPDFRNFPYPSLQSTGNIWALGRIAESTGIFDITRNMRERIQRLKDDHAMATYQGDDINATNIERRIEFLKKPRATFFFNMMLPYNILLEECACVVDPDNVFEGRLDKQKVWTVDFWMGAWDGDASCGFMEGFLNIPELVS